MNEESTEINLNRSLCLRAVLVFNPLHLSRVIRKNRRPK